MGNLRTCLYAYMFAKQNGGKFLLRIEDTDQAREVGGAVEAILKTLNLAGISFDEGPFYQSKRKKIYKKWADELIKRGGAYKCYCTPQRLSSLGEVKKYDKHCCGAPDRPGEPYVIRQNIPQNEGFCEYVDTVYGKISVPYSELEDGILLKSDGMPTYNFANVIDDRLMKITHVIRGNEYLSSTPKYNLIYDAFGWKRPQYMHLAPIMRDEKNKLSKRHGDANFEDFLQRGFLPQAIVNYIALLGWSPGDNSEKMTVEEMTRKFSAAGVSKSGSIFDEAKLRWLNAEYIKELPDGAFPSPQIAKLLRPRLELMSEIPEKLAFLTFNGDYDVALFENKKQKIDIETARRALDVCAAVLPSIEVFTDENLKCVLTEAAAQNNLKTGQIFLPLRLAITGLPVTPGGATEIAEVLGKQETLARLKVSMTKLNKA